MSRGGGGRTPTKAGAWVLASRPKTLPAAAAPVIVGTATAYAAHALRPWPALAALAGALLIQIGTNFANDVFDFRRGADTGERLGPVRVTQAGLLAPGEVLAGAWVAFGLAAVAGAYLAAVAGWFVVVIGLLAIGSGIAYTAGPFPIGYHGLGELFVFVFFGLVAVGGTHFVQAGVLAPAAVWAGVPMGLLAAAILVVNNLRDAATDRAAGKRTLAVRLGERAARAEYGALLAAAFAAPPAAVAAGAAPPSLLLALGALPLAVAPLRRVLRERGGALNPALGETGRLELAFAALYAAGLALGRR
ncbi:MAG: 1,4-dihydroxy-2-naphthoate polyprenyltransferase [Acidobacteria bacterium]|nr:MAG: 1,4-dihydroxy-2-naphthoate polyprenyltransferase [Acidobacteriota bacterium]